MKKIFGLVLAAALIFGLASCSKDNVMEEGGVTTGSAMKFTFEKPKGDYTTYADIASDEEWKIATGGLDVYTITDNVVAKLTADTDYIQKETDREYTITMSTTWAQVNNGKTVDFYFVGNDGESAEGAHTGLGTTAKQDFMDAVTNALTANIEIDLTDKHLLFSTQIQGVQIAGKISESATLKRRVARFDVLNTKSANDEFKVSRILVSNAKTKASIFSVGDPTKVLATDISSFVVNSGLVAADYKNDLKTSLFYLYPTEMSSAAGDGKTEITIEGSYNGGATESYAVDASSIGYQIEANKRYTLVLDPESGKIRIMVGDWDPGENKLPALPGGDDSFAGFSAVAAGTNAGNYNPTTQVYTFGASDDATITIDVKTKYGTNHNTVFINGDDTKISNYAVAKTTTATYAGYEITEKYTVTVPRTNETGSINLRLEIYSPNGDAKETILFTNGVAMDDAAIAEAVKGNDELVDAIKKAVEANKGDVENITAEDLEKITSIDVSGAEGPSSLAGIENLQNLTEINAAGNTNLTEVDLSGNPELVIVNLTKTSIVTVDLTGSKIEEFRAASCSELTSVELGQNEHIKILRLEFCPNLSSADVTGCPNLEEYAVHDANLSSVDVTKNSKLIKLAVQLPNMTTLDLSNNPELKYLYASRTGLISLDLSKCPKIVDLDLGISPELASVDLSSCTEITKLLIQRNKLLSLDIQNCGKLESLQANDILTLASVTLGSHPNLTYMNLANSVLLEGTLDISGCENLATFVIDRCEKLGAIKVWSEFNLGSPASNFTSLVKDGTAAEFVK